MAVKKIAYDQEARERMRDGVKQLARACLLYTSRCV